MLTLLRRLLLHCARLWRAVLHRLCRIRAHPFRRRLQTGAPPRRYRAHPKPAWVRDEIIWLKALMPEAGCRTVSHCFNRRFASRACLYLQRLPDKCTFTVLQSLAATIRQYGRPRFLRTDNEAVFTSWRLRLVLRVLGIHPQRTDPHCPWQNGRVERFIGTVKRVLAPHAVEHAEQLDTVLHHTRFVYNHLRPHQHLHGRTPAEVWAGVDVFAPTVSGRMWLRRWERHWRQSIESAPSRDG